MKHNNQLSDVHRSKHYITRTKTWFNQPGRKRRRRVARVEKAKSGRPIDTLRPNVKCPTQKYHAKSRLGRGFSLGELKAAGIKVRYAPTVGISVDRRRNSCRQTNIDLLKTYQSKLVVFPKGKAPADLGATKSRVNTVPNNTPAWEEVSL